MSTFTIDLTTCPAELRDGLAEILVHRRDAFDPGGTPVTFIPHTQPGFTISPGIIIGYHTKTDAFRALGRVFAGETALTQASSLHMCGAMVDVSRNGVLTVPAAKDFLRCCALLGLNMLMLYSEDTYEVPGEPFFGYLRGRYTQEEMRELDDYAFALGIEMIPCIQTLAHLEQILQWPAYAEVKDTWNILLADDEQTYALVEKLITAASAPFRSKRIHLGMDEAQGLGSGRFKELKGEKSGFAIINAHLARVKAICDTLGLRPMIWGDMYIHLASPTGSIYDYGATIPQEVLETIPRGVDLVYWDYYHTEVTDYTRGIDLYRSLGSPVLMAGGGWTWGRLWAHLPYAFAATDACLTACTQKGMTDYFITLWGDDGMECDVFSALPALALVAEYAYTRAADPAGLRAQFRGACAAEMDDFITGSTIDYLANEHDGTKGPDNMSKWLLWQDPLLALTDPNTAGAGLREYYTTIADTLDVATTKGGLSWRLALPARIARTLSLKVELRRQLETAYRAGDTATLRIILNGDLAQLRTAMDGLWRCHRDHWLATYHPFGLEVLELRYGGQRTRLESLSERLQAYLDGSIANIPELAAELLKVWDGPLKDVCPDRQRVQTPSMIK